MRTMEKDIFDIIREKEFAELSLSECEELNSLCSNEKEYDQIRSLLTGVAGIQKESLVPDASVKEKLDDLFYTQFPKTVQTSYAGETNTGATQIRWFKSPLVRIAAVLAILLLAYPFFRNSFQNDSTKLAENKVFTKTDEKQDVQQTITEKSTKSGQETRSFVQPENHLMRDELSLSPSIASEDKDAFYPEGASVTSGMAYVHPDGIYDALDSESESVSLSADEMLSVLDLLTVTF